jgi:hypothetical protein
MYQYVPKCQGTQADFLQRCFETCRLIKSAHGDIKANSTNKRTRINLFTEALDRLPKEEIETQRLADEALVLITAGSETTSRALATLIYHVLENPNILTNLQQELDAAIPDANTEVSYSRLEVLPYLVRLFINFCPQLHSSLISSSDGDNQRITAH